MIQVAEPSVGEEELEALKKVLYSGNYVSGKNVKAFEEAWAEYIGVKHAVMLSSGTDALILSLIGHSIQPGEEVIVPPLTFFATIAAPIHVGARPVFADIDPETYCLDPESVKEVMTEKTAAIIPVHIFGHPADMDAINDLVCESSDGKLRKPYVIEDAAQAHGAEYKGRKCGSLGNSATWSFYATKNMTTGEEGGAVTTNDGWVAKRIQILRTHGMPNRDTHVWVGYNNRMSEFGGAMGLVQLRKLDEMNAVRTRNSEYLTQELGKLGIPWLKLPTVKSHVKHAYFWYPILIDEEKFGLDTLELRQMLRERGIGTRHRYTEPLYKQPALMPYGTHYNEISLPNAESICGRMLGLPNHQNLKMDALNYIVEVFKELK